MRNRVAHARPWEGARSDGSAVTRTAPAASRGIGPLKDRSSCGQDRRRAGIACRPQSAARSAPLTAASHVLTPRRSPPFPLPDPLTGQRYKSRLRCTAVAMRSNPGIARALADRTCVCIVMHSARPTGSPTAQRVGAPGRSLCPPAGAGDDTRQGAGRGLRRPAAAAPWMWAAPVRPEDRLWPHHGRPLLAADGVPGAASGHRTQDYASKPPEDSASSHSSRSRRRRAPAAPAAQQRH